MVPKWVAWYTNDRRFYSDDIEWRELPYTGVLGIVIAHAQTTAGGVFYKQQISGGDWYYLDPKTGLPACTETHEKFGSYVKAPDYLVDRELIKRGEMTTKERWQEIRHEMTEVFR